MATLEQVIFLGTGCSSCTPNVTCLTNPEQSCKSCLSSMTPDGRKNRRNNVSIAIRFRDHNDPPGHRLRTIIIDCGKTFYESSINLFPMYGIRQIDAVILTHGHLDSISGLDDLRSLTLGNSIQDKVDIYLTKETMETVGNTYPFLVNSSLATGGGDVATFKFHLLDPLAKFTIHGLTLEPLPVHHGIYFTTKEPYIFYGFQFHGVTYISDTNHIPKETMDRIKKEKTNILVLDCLKCK
ncbi:beta-lactamase-like protein [Cunninghamella echinulata]|nr:beta-lactamase-like protein [Cunninghamella echinulata]